MAKLKNKFELEWSSADVYLAEHFMDFLKMNEVKHEITLADMNATKNKVFVFKVYANRLNVALVNRWFETEGVC